MAPTRQPALWATGIIFTILSTTALVLRVYARHITSQGLGKDDYLIILSYLFGMAYQVCIFLWTAHGLGLFLEDITWYTPEQALQVTATYLYPVELVYAASLAFSQLALLSFLWRVFGSSKIRVPVLILVALVILWLMARTLVAIFHCWPIHAYWDKSVEAAYCINDSTFIFATVLIHVVLDLCILAVPLFQIHQLQLRRAQRAALMILFGFGFVVCVSSILTATFAKLFDPYSPEVNWGSAGIMIWGNVEVNLGILSACLPLLRPVYSKILQICGVRSSHDGSGGGGGGGAGTGGGGASHSRGTRTTKSSFIRLKSLHNNDKNKTAASTMGTSRDEKSSSSAAAVAAVSAADESDSVRKLAAPGHRNTRGCGYGYGFQTSRYRAGSDGSSSGDDDNLDLERGGRGGGGLEVRVTAGHHHDAGSEADLEEAAGFSSPVDRPGGGRGGGRGGGGGGIMVTSKTSVVVSSGGKT